MKERYWLREDTSSWREVTQEEFIQAESDAGFQPKSGCGPVATAGFSSEDKDGCVEGRITYGK